MFQETCIETCTQTVEHAGGRGGEAAEEMFAVTQADLPGKLLEYSTHGYHSHRC